MDRPPNVEISVTPSANGLDLAWSDVEDRLQGSISPRYPVEGTQLDVSAHVGSFQGVEFDGPLTFSLKPIASTGGGKSMTVKRGPGEKAWRAHFVPQDSGYHTLEISFSTTRMKVASSKILIGDAKVPRWPWWILVGVTGAVALGLGMRSLFRKAENT